MTASATAVARVIIPEVAAREQLVAIVTSDDSFTADERAVAIELIDAALAGSSDYVLLAAEDAGRLGGYVCYGPTPMTQATWDLYWIVVHADARGRGLAATLVTALEDDIRARGGRHIRVETSETEGYGAARRLYARLGYPVAATLTDFYRPGDALITYFKTLSP